MNKKIFFLTNSAGKIPQKLHETVGLDLIVISEYFIAKGFETNILAYDDFLFFYEDYSNNIKNNFFFYASSQYPSYYSYIDDILLFIKDNGGILLPEYSLFKAHENKFFQELNKKKLSISSPNSILIGTIEEGLEKIKKINFPIVAKLSNGFGSSTVSLLNTGKEAKEYLEQNLIDTIKKRKNIFKHKKNVAKYVGKYPLKTGKIIFQEFIKNLEYDWKILIYGDKLFYLKRNIRENDFRASGSGSFDNKTRPSKEVMNFAKDVYIKLKTPFASLDIIERKGKNCMLIEYQALHFGLYTAINSISHFIYNKNIDKWEEGISNNINIDTIYAEELHNFMLKNYNL